MTEKACISCGMPLRSAEDYPLGDESKSWCVHCATPDGELKSYEEALVGMTGFIVQTQGLDQGAAQEVAKDMMSKMPAWQGQG